MTGPGIAYVLLYRTERNWRITVGEIEPEGMACGALPNVPPDVPVDEAKTAFCQHIKRYWGRELSPDLLQPVEGKPDWFGANLSSEKRLEDLAEA